jgi:hypothetical protein
MLMLLTQCCSLSDLQDQLETQARLRCLSASSSEFKHSLVHASPVLHRLNHASRRTAFTHPTPNRDRGGRDDLSV